MPEIDVSIIIPTFNRLWCLPDAVQSCRTAGARTEIIVIDDGSTDGTWEWLGTQPDVIAVSQPNWGQTWAQNRGFSLARGEFIRYLDSDDLILEGAIDRQLEIARRTVADVVVAGYVHWFDASGDKQIREWQTCDDFIAQQLGECDSSHCYAYLYRKDFIVDVPHRPDYAFREDRLFAIEVALKHPKVQVLDTPAYVLREHGNNRLQAQRRMATVVQNWQHWQLYRRALGILESRGELTERRKRAAIRVLWPLAHWVGKSNPAEAAEIAAWIYQLDPEFTPPERGALGWLYRNAGFVATQRLLRLRRSILGLSPFSRQH